MNDIVTGDNYANNTTDRVGNWMQTFTGRMFWPLDPRSDEVFIEDIAHGLALSCRYAGHCLTFYSVAEHSVLMSYIVPRELALVALLHDATEAYVVDVPRPLKPFLPNFKDIENGVWAVIAERFDLPLLLPDAIKEADNAMLLAEQRDIMAPAPAPWCVPGVAAEISIQGWNPAEAEYVFLKRFEELTA